MPSFNARAQIQDDLFLRLAASRTVTRPTFAQLNPGLTLNNSTATLLGSGSSGNPALAPVKSDNADLTLEYYFGPTSSVTGAVFYRHVYGYIQNEVTSSTLAGVTYNITSPVNASAGVIKGLEVGYTQFFDFLPGWWNGLGVQANGTYVDGTFANISRYSYNLVGIYEHGPVSFRVAYNWRAGFLAGPADGGGQQPGTVYADAQPWLDLSASYKVNDNLTLTFDATNLLDSYYQDHFGKGAANAYAYSRDTRRFDQTIEFGLRYKM
jgi:TonB-dependent receptor